MDLDGFILENPTYKNMDVVVPPFLKGNLQLELSHMAESQCHSILTMIWVVVSNMAGLLSISYIRDSPSETH